jgi:hypothetical protein
VRSTGAIALWSTIMTPEQQAFYLTTPIEHFTVRVNVDPNLDRNYGPSCDVRITCILGKTHFNMVFLTDEHGELGVPIAVHAVRATLAHVADIKHSGRTLKLPAFAERLWRAVSQEDRARIALAGRQYRAALRDYAAAKAQAPKKKAA